MVFFFDNLILLWVAIIPNNNHVVNPGREPPAINKNIQYIVNNEYINGEYILF